MAYLYNYFKWITFIKAAKYLAFWGYFCIDCKLKFKTTCELDDLLFEGSEIYSEAIKFFKEILGVKAAPKYENELKKIEKLSKFKEFKIAIKDRLPENLSAYKANFIELNAKMPCGYDLLKADEELAYKLASKIVFTAFDSGADFLLASSEAEFYIFDTLAKKLEKSANRSLQDFYVPRAS